MSLWSFWLAVCFSHRKNDERSYMAFHTVHFADTHSNTHTQDRFILQFKHLHKLGATVWRGILLPARLLLFYSSCKKRQWHGDVYKSLWAMRLNWLTADHIHISYPRSCCINGASVEYKEIQTHTLLGKCRPPFYLSLEPLRVSGTFPSSKDPVSVSLSLPLSLKVRGMGALADFCM